MAGTEGNLGSQGIFWQPSHVFDEIHLGHERSQEPRNRIKYFNAETLPPQYKCTSKVPHYRPRPRPYANMSPGMQAVFVDSDRKSGGTGVFLPRRTANVLQPTKKPAPMYAPVLKPARIVQTLNVNVPELGIQPWPRTDVKDKPKTGILITKKNKDDSKDGSTEVCGMSEKLSPSPETYLPKEWTY